MRVLIPFLAAIGLLGLVAACAVNPATGEREFVLMSEESELEIGRRLHQQILQVESLYDDPELQRYVQEVGERVAAVADRPDLIYRFFVIDSPQVNAFALPGGYIYIYRGLMAYLGTEAELAAVLGHEVAHVTARHAVRQHRNATLTQLLAVAAAVGAGSTTAGDLTNILGTAFVAGYGRELELESDRLGAEYLARAGYDHRSILEVLEVLKYQQEFANARAEAEGREPMTYHGVFATHPQADTRLQEVVYAADKLAPAAGQRIGREAYLAQMEGVVYGYSAKEGIPRGDSFYHPDLGFAFDFPADWRIENLPQAVVLFAPEGRARIEIGATDLNRRLPPAEFVRQRLGVENALNARTFEKNGLTLYTALVPQTTFGGDVWHLGVVYFDNRAYIFQGGYERDAPPDFGAAFNDTITSFRRLSERDRENAEPWRIRIEQAEPGWEYEELAARSPLGEDAAAQLRLLNQDYPSGSPTAGQAIKLVE